MTSRYMSYFEDSSDMSKLDIMFAIPKPDLKVLDAS